MKIKETHLEELGFTRNDITAEESGDVPYYYYTLDLSENRNVCLISCSSTDVVDGEWWVEFFEAEDIKFLHVEHLESFLHAVRVAKEYIELDKKYSPKNRELK